MKKLAELIVSVQLLFFWSGLPAQNSIVQIPDVAPEDRICFPMYTVHDQVLKMTVLFYPLDTHEPLETQLEQWTGEKWDKIAEAKIVYPGYTAHFRVENWDDTREVRYRVNHNNTAFEEGIIRKNPEEKDEVVVAAFTCNAISPEHGGDLPRTDIIENIKRIKPDVLFFSGDQVYHHCYHYAAWLKFGQDFGSIIRDYPTICIPDDHDIGQYNIWGNGGKGVPSSKHGDEGGYYMPVEYVKEVERAQTSHLPDPYDPTPLSNGLGVYYTDYTWGGISFAILEDRKFKSGPRGLVPQKGPRPDHYTNADYDPQALDVSGAKLLGDRQLDFLRIWTTDWADAEMKVVLSQTIFAGGAHLHGHEATRLYADLDSNGWPQTGRNKALREIRKGFGFMIGGDQHLGTVMQHGIDDWGDAGYSFCVPAIANLYPRWWHPLTPGQNRRADQPWYTGDHKDGFGNKVTLYAAANPDTVTKIVDSPLDTRSAGFGVVTLNKKTRQITMDCWRRNTEVTRDEQYPGWPVTISQEDNYGRRPKAFLPVLQMSLPDQVIQVVNEATEEIVYTIRARGDQYQPRVFSESLYTLRIGEGKTMKVLKGLEAKLKQKRKLKVEL